MTRCSQCPYLILGLLLASSIGAVLLVESVRAEEKGAAGQRSDLVRVQHIEAATGYQVERQYTGELRAARSSALAFELSGKVLEILVDVGSKVEAGEALARLDTRRLFARRAELEAQQRAAKAQLDEMLSGPRVEVIAASRSEMQALEAESVLADLRLGRRSDLVQRDIVAPEVHDEALAEAGKTKARLQAARSRLEELEAGTRAETIEAQRAALAQLDASLATVDIDIEDSTLKAPYAATVAARDVDEGRVLAAGTAVLRLVEGERLEAWIGLPERQVATALAATDLELTVGARKPTIHSTRLLPELNAGTRTATLVLDLEANSALALMPGQIARLQMHSTVKSPGYWLPTRSLDESGRGLWSCLIATESEDGSLRAERAEVEVLHTDGDRVFVRGTLRAGDRVITSGVHKLVPGRLIRLAPETQTSLRQEAAQ